MFGKQRKKYKMLDKSNQKFKVIKSKLELLSSNETRTRGFTHRFRMNIFGNFSVNRNHAKDYVENDLCRFRGITLISGERLYFQIDKGWSVLFFLCRDMMDLSEAFLTCNVWKYHCYQHIPLFLTSFFPLLPVFVNYWFVSKFDK